MTGDLFRPSEESFSRLYLMGGAIGLALGLLSVHLYIRAAGEHEVEPGQVKTMDVIRLAVAMTAIVRQITDLGARKN